MNVGADTSKPTRYWAHRRGDTYVLITSNVVGNEHRLDIAYYLAPGRYASLSAAKKAGFRTLHRSDDFNMGVVRDGRLVAILWMNQIVDDEPDVVERIAEEVGLDR
jgi:hypothetical protein